MAAGSGVLRGPSFSLGLTGGVRPTDDFQYAATSESKRYVAGLTAVAGLPMGFSIEFDALYRRQGYNTAAGTALYTATIHETDNVWEFPLLARYRVPVRGIRPFAEAGWAPRMIHGTKDASGSYLSQLNPPVYTQYSSQTHTEWPTTHGAIVGGGIEFSAGRLRFAPEVRYTHWNRQAISGNFADGPSYGSSQNQLDILLGVTWQVRQ